MPEKDQLNRPQDDAAQDPDTSKVRNEVYSGADEVPYLFSLQNVADFITSGIDEVRQSLTDTPGGDGVKTDGANAKAFESEYGPDGVGEGD